MACYLNISSASPRADVKGIKLFLADLFDMQDGDHIEGRDGVVIFIWFSYGAFSF